MTPTPLDGFAPVGFVAEPITRSSRSAARGGYRVYGDGAGYEVAIPEAVVERMLAIGRRAAPNEWYALVVGRVFEDGAGEHAVVLGVVPDPEAETGPAFVRTTSESEFRTRLSARLLFPDGQSLGWCHGHINYGAVYSGTDRKNQSTWPAPWAVGIVVDPWSEPQLGVYRGPDSVPLHLVAPVVRARGVVGKTGLAAAAGGGLEGSRLGGPSRGRFASGVLRLLPAVTITAGIALGAWSIVRVAAAERRVARLGEEVRKLAQAAGDATRRAPSVTPEASLESAASLACLPP